jgi:hypothetical protein
MDKSPTISINSGPVVNSFELKHLYIVLGIFLILFLVFYVIYVLYNFLYSTKIETIKQEYQNNLIQNLKTTDAYDCNNKYADKYLSDFYIASSANTFLLGKQNYDYVSLDMIKNALIMGARYIELNILGDSVSNNSIPVVTTGVEEGNWQTSVNSLYLENVCETIAAFAFSKEIKTNQLPLFIYLKLKVSEQPFIIKKITKILKDYFPSKLEKEQPNGNRFDNNIDPAKSKICTLFNQVIIWSDAVNIKDNYDDVQKEIVNEYNSTINKFPPQRLHYSEIINQTVLDTKRSQTPEDKRRKADELTEKNRTQLTIVYPNKESSNDNTSYNYDPDEAWSYGCQFVALNYQTNDENRTKYFEKFKTDSLSIKPSVLQRFVKEPETVSLDKKVRLQEDNKDKYRKQLPFLYKEEPVYLRPYNSPTKVISIEDKSFVIKEMTEKDLTTNEGFLIQANLNNPADSLKICFESLKHPSHYVSFDGRSFNLYDWRIKKYEQDKDSFVKSTTFVPKKSLMETRGNTTLNADEKSNLYSFFVNGVEKEPMVFHTPSNSIITKKDDIQDFEITSSASFFMYKLPVIKSYNIRQSDNLYFESINSMIVKKNRDYGKAGIFEFISERDLNLNLDNATTENFIHIKDFNNKFWSIDNGSLRSSLDNPGYNTRFFIKKIPSTAFSQIMYGNNKTPLTVSPDGIVRQAYLNEVNNIETYLIINTSYKKKNN